MSRQARATLAFLSLIFVTCGCQRVYPFVPVEGTVTHSGKPLEGVQVMFLADTELGTEGPRSWGMTDASGHYRLHTDCGDIGAVVGKHRVCIQVLPSPEEFAPRHPHRVVPASTKTEGGTDRNKSRKSAGPNIPAVYNQFHKTPLHVEVRPGKTQTIDFDIP